MEDLSELKRTILAQQRQLEVLSDLGNLVVQAPPHPGWRWRLPLLSGEPCARAACRQSQCELAASPFCLASVSKDGPPRQAHFAIRDHHDDLCSHVRCICDCLDAAGVVSRLDLLKQINLQRRSLILLGALHRPEVACSIALALGRPGLGPLGAASRRCLECLEGAPRRLAEPPAAAGPPVRAPLQCATRAPCHAGEATAEKPGTPPRSRSPSPRPSPRSPPLCSQPLLSCPPPSSPGRGPGAPRGAGAAPLLAETGVPLEHLLEAEELAPGAGAPEGRGCCELLQHLWQDSSFADVLTFAMDPASIGRFRAVSRACRECMRALHEAPARPKCARGLVGEAESLRELPGIWRAAPLRKQPAGAAPDQQGPCMGGTCQALLQELWQYPMLTEVLARTMGTRAMTCFRGTSRGVLECMRECTRGCFAGVCFAHPPALKAMEGVAPAVRACSVPLAMGTAHADRAREPVGVSGSKVVVHSVSSRPELNGCSGHLVTRQGSRWLVRLDGDKAIRIHEKHLEQSHPRNAAVSSALGWDGPTRRLQVSAQRAQQAGPQRVRKKSSRQPAEQPAGQPPRQDCSAQQALQLPRAVAELLRLLEPQEVRPLALLSVRFCHSVSQPKLCVIGGVGADGRGIGVPECFDLSARRWLPLPALRWKRIETQVVTCGGSVYAIGGRDHHCRSLGLVERLAPWGDGWEPMRPLRVPRCFATVAAIAGGICVAGGFSDKKQHLCSAEWFSPARGVWQVMQDMAESRSWASAAVAGGRALFVCGGTTLNVLCSVERLEFIGMRGATNASWRWVPPMQQARIYSAAVIVRGYLYVIGGTDSYTSLSSVERLWLTRGSNVSFSRGELWERLPPMNEPRVGAAVASTSKGLICVCGGCSLRGTGLAHHQSAELFDPNACVWHELPSMVHSRSYAGFGAVGGRLYIVGGQSNRQTHLQDGECLDLATFTWEPLPPMLYARLAPSSIVARR